MVVVIVVEGLKLRPCAADRNENGYVEIEELKDFARDEVYRRSGGRQTITMAAVLAGENFALAKRKDRSPQADK